MMRSIELHKITISFSRYIVFFVIIVAPYLMPYYLRQEILPASVNTLMDFLSIALMAFFVIKYLPGLKQVSTRLILVGIMYLLLIYSSYINGGEAWTATLRMIRIVLMCATVSIVAIRSEKFGIWFLYAVKYYTLIFCLANIILMFIYPTGIPSYTAGKLAPHFLYANVNTTIKFLFPGMLCSTLVDLRKKRISFGTFALWFCLIYQFLFIYRTATSFIALLFVTLWVLFRNIISGKIKTIYLISLILILVLEVSIVLVSNTSVIGFIAGLFGKTSDFTGRLILWQRVARLIHEKPIWGYGLQSSELIRMSIGNSSGSHNYYLDMVYQQGIVGLAIFLYFAINPLIQIRRNIHISQTLYVLLGYCIAYLIMFISEPFYGHEITYFPIFFCSVALCYVDNGLIENTSSIKVRW